MWAGIALRLREVNECREKVHQENGTGAEGRGMGWQGRAGQASQRRVSYPSHHLPLLRAGVFTLLIIIIGLMILCLQPGQAVYPAFYRTALFNHGNNPKEVILGITILAVRKVRQKMFYNLRSTHS